MEKSKIRRYTGLALLLLVIVNYIALAFRWIWWSLDDQYGCGERIRMNISYEEFLMVKDDLNEMYSEIYFDIFYFAGFTFVLCLLFMAVLNTYRNDTKKKDNNEQRTISSKDCISN